MNIVLIMLNGIIDIIMNGCEYECSGIVSNVKIIIIDKVKLCICFVILFIFF